MLWGGTTVTYHNRSVILKPTDSNRNLSRTPICIMISCCLANGISGLVIQML